MVGIAVTRAYISISENQPVQSDDLRQRGRLWRKINFGLVEMLQVTAI